MTLYNNTPMEAFYGISAGDNPGDCGTIPANQTTDLPQYDNKQNVTVTFEAVGASNAPGESTPFSITIPKSGTGMAVTIGLYQE